MSVTDDAKSYHVLEAFHKDTIPDTELMLAVDRRVVANHDSETTGSFNFLKLNLEPFKLVARVIVHTPDVEVKRVTIVGVVGNHARASGELFAVLELANVLRVVAVLHILLFSLGAEPFVPELRVVVNFVVQAGLLEGLFINGPSVMVAMDGQYRDVRVLYRILNHVGNHLGVSSHFLVGIVPDVVR